MESLTLELMRRMTALAGFSWTDEELQAIAPLVERGRAALQTLDRLPLRDEDLSTVFHAG